jgi:hypothetical protein
MKLSECRPHAEQVRVGVREPGQDESSLQIDRVIRTRCVGDRSGEHDRVAIDGEGLDPRLLRAVVGREDPAVAIERGHGRPSFASGVRTRIAYAPPATSIPSGTERSMNPVAWAMGPAHTSVAKHSAVVMPPASSEASPGMLHPAVYQ